MSSADTPNVPKLTLSLLTLTVHSSYASWGSNGTLVSSADNPNLPKPTLNPKGSVLYAIWGSNDALMSSVNTPNAPNQHLTLKVHSWM